MTKALRVRFWFIRVSRWYSKDFHCPLHKTPKPFFHHHFALMSGRSQFHFPPLFPPQLPSVSHFLRLTTILVTVIITGTKYLIETNNERKVYLGSRFQRIQTMTFSITKCRLNLMAGDACKGGSHQDDQETESKETRAQEKMLPKTPQHCLTSKGGSPTGSLVFTTWALGGN